MLDEYRELLLHRTITQQPNKVAEAVTLVTCFLDVPRSNLDGRCHSSDCMCDFPQSIQRLPEKCLGLGHDHFDVSHPFRRCIVRNADTYKYC